MIAADMHRSKMGGLLAALFFGLLFIGVPCLVLYLVSWTWPYFGAGLEDVSPDGKYDAQALFYFNRHREWLVLSITDRSSEKVIWERNLGKRRRHHPPFDQGFGYKLVGWSKDSTEARFAYRCDPADFEVVEWMIVKLDGQGRVIAVEIVPGSRFPPIKPNPRESAAGTDSSVPIDSQPPSTTQPDGRR